MLRESSSVSSCPAGGSGPIGCSFLPGMTGARRCLWFSTCTGVGEHLPVRRETADSKMWPPAKDLSWRACRPTLAGGMFRSENRPDDVAYVGDVIDDVAAQLCTDKTRVYATGFSGGARMSSLLGCMLNGRIAA